MLRIKRRKPVSILDRKLLTQFKYFIQNSRQQYPGYKHPFSLRSWDRNSKSQIQMLKQCFEFDFWLLDIICNLCFGVCDFLLKVYQVFQFIIFPEKYLSEIQ